MWTIRKVTNPFDIDQAFDWYLETPKVLKALCDPYFSGERKQFVESVSAGHNFRGSMDGDYQVLIHGEIKSPDLIEGHLFCDKKASIELISSTISYARISLLENYKMVVCHVLKRHRTLNKIMSLSGFADSGLRAWQGIYKNAPMDIIYYTAGR